MWLLRHNRDEWFSAKSTCKHSHSHALDIESLRDWQVLFVVDDLPSINPLAYDGILDLTNLKAITDDEINVSKMVICFDRIENILGKGENADW